MAALTLDGFQEAQPSGLDLFTLPPTQTAVENVYYDEVRSTSQLTGTGPVNFSIAANNSLEYIDLRKTRLYVKARIKHIDGTSLKPTEFVGPVNNFLHSIFSQVDIALQNKLVSSSTSHYNYKSYIQTLLSYGSEAKESQLSSQLWKKDKTVHFDDNDVENGSNSSLYDRSQYFSGSQVCDMEGPLLNDLCSLDRYMLNQVAINVCKIVLNPSVLTAHNQKLQKVQARYPFTRTELRLISTPAGSLNFNYNDLFNGLRPTRCCIGFVDSSSTSGSYAFNPFNFQHFNLSQIALKLNHFPVGGNVMQLNYGANSRTVLPAFTSMFDVKNKWMRDSGNQLSRDDVAEGNALYCFDIEPNFSDEGQYLNLVKQGTCSLETIFSKPLKKATTCVVYAEFPAYFEINLERNIILE
ncbi:unnamed protein product [Mytilus coruscus]|uniref:Uncharacterized protein n=1 Tax=Mytilus coruscus TaxID=42192 RepID=A0A6J8BPQ2_MYTCO|nr:unnamed protein product [Mytilus coruscus]